MPIISVFMWIFMFMNGIKGDIIVSDNMDTSTWNENGPGSFNIVSNNQYCESGTCYQIIGGGGGGSIQTITKTFNTSNYYNVFFTVYTSTISVDNNEQTAIQYACDNNAFIDKTIDGGDENNVEKKFTNMSINYDDTTCNDAVNTLTIQFRCESCNGNQDWYYIDSLTIYGSTLSPTTSPSFMPSVSPSISPTEAPTNTPSLMPTNIPTMSPTIEPTSTPSQSPTTNPSTNPTISPSQTPTVPPTTYPSINPTLASQFPSITPSISPLKTSPNNANSETINPKIFIWLGTLLFVLCVITAILIILYIKKVLPSKRNKNPRQVVIKTVSKTNTTTTDIEMVKTDTFTNALATGELNNPTGLSPRNLYFDAALDSLRDFENDSNIEGNITDGDPIISDLNDDTHSNIKKSVV